LLQRTAGRRVRLRFGPHPDAAPEETIEAAVRPVNRHQYEYLRYRAWVYANEAFVHRISAGRLGYVHIRGMSYEAYQQFLVDLDSEIYRKEGVVVDARFNSGGHTSTFILDVLARRSLLRSAFRDRTVTDAAYVAGNRVLDRPTVLVTNESSASDTETFSEGYRRLGLGKVVGRPTAGAVIWTYNYRLMDGSYLRLPRLRVATPEGEDLEGKGRAVDVDVPLPMGAPARGEDPQLEAAARTLLVQIDTVR
jgi:C-terminal processing protease CtpA/Prc